MAQAIYEFRIGLQRVKPPIWRRIQVPGNYNFFDLHVAIQDLFQLSDHRVDLFGSDIQLHKFEMVKPKRDTLAMLLSGNFELDEYIGIPDGRLEGDFNIIPEKETRICDHFGLDDADKTKCVYTTDFGLGWQYDILLECILPAVPYVVYPRCVAGRQSPLEHRPEDWPFLNESPFSKDAIVFRVPRVVWKDYAFQRF